MRPKEDSLVIAKTVNPRRNDHSEVGDPCNFCGTGIGTRARNGMRVHTPLQWIFPIILSSAVESFIRALIVPTADRTDSNKDLFIVSRSSLLICPLSRDDTQ